MAANARDTAILYAVMVRDKSNFLIGKYLFVGWRG